MTKNKLSITELQKKRETTNKKTLFRLGLKTHFGYSLYKVFNFFPNTFFGLF